MSQKPDRNNANPPPAPAGNSYYGHNYGYGGYYGGSVYGHPSSLHSFTMSTLLRLLRRKWPLLFLTAVLGVSAALAHIMTSTKLYRATSSVEMSLRRPRVMSGGEAVLEDQMSTWNYEKVFNTRIEKFRGKVTRDIAGTIFDAQSQSNATLPQASFSLVEDSFLVNISCVSESPETVAAGANAYAEATVQVMADENREMSDNAVLWLKAQAEAQKEELERAEKVVADFRTEHNLDLIENQRTAFEASLRKLSEALTEVQADLLKMTEIHAALNRGEIPDSMPASGEMTEQLAALRQARVDEQALLTRYRDEHPKVTSAHEKITLLTDALEKSISNAAERAGYSISLLTKQRDGLEKHIHEQEQKAAENEKELVRLRARLASLERERSVADMSYNSVLRRMEEARLSSDENTVAIKVVKSAEPPKRPFSPQPLRIGLLGLMFGLSLGLGLALAQDWFEDYVTSVEDLENGLGLKVLGILPRTKGARERADVALSVANRDNHQLIEAVAGVRATIIGSTEPPPKALLVTSAGVQCGKTVVACNLATMLAKSEQRTLLVDLDLRRPRVARIFSLNLSKDQSLAHALTKKSTDYGALVSPTQVSNLFVVGSLGDSRISPADIVGGPAMTAFLEWAHAEFDHVVIDSPPHGLMSDALVLASHVDGVILVCRHEKSRKRAIRHTIRQMQHVDVAVLGIVVNAAPLGGGVLSKYDYYHGSYSFDDYAPANAEETTA